MAKRWRMVRLPEELAAELDELGDVYLRAHAEMRTTLPPEVVDAGRVPHWYVIRKALRQLQHHRQRSTYAARRERELKRRAIATASSELQNSK